MPSIINSPPTNAVDTQNGEGMLMPPSEGWRNFFNAVFNVCNALTQSGTTARRPTTLLWVGRTYFDVTLNRPIWYTGTNWIRADGTVV